MDSFWKLELRTTTTLAWSSFSGPPPLQELGQPCAPLSRSYKPLASAQFVASLPLVHILVAEDDKKTASFISKALKAEGFGVDVMGSGDEALAAVKAVSFDAVILDIMLIGRDGLSVVRQMRAQGIRTPVLLLSARGETNERVEGLNAGADDYLPKPFALAELIARLRALLRRGGTSASSLLRVGDLTMDLLTRVVRRGDSVIELSGREYRVLEYLMRSVDRVCSRSMILEKVWEYSFDPGSNLVDVYIAKLREKIDSAQETKLLHSIRGVGYSMKEPT